MCTTVRFFYGILTICLASAMAGQIVAEDDSIEVRRYRCGFNAVYVLLRLSGFDFDYGSLQINRNAGARGISIKEIVDELARCGLPSRAIQCRNPNEIRSLSPPFIIYTNPDRSGSSIGHFLVVTRIMETRIELIDGTTGEIDQYVIDKLGNLWDGYAIVPDQNHSDGRRWIFASILAVCGVTMVAISFAYAPRRGRKAAAVLLFGIFFGFAHYGQPISYASELFEPKRERGQSSVNALYLLSRHHGIDTQKAEFSRAAVYLQAAPDMLSLSRAFSSLGCSTRVVRLGVGDLDQTNLPCCLLLNGEGTTSGQWSLLLYVESDHVGVIRGDSMIVDLVSISDFRSQWDGYALVVTNSSIPWIQVLRVSSLLVSVGVVVLFFCRGITKCAKAS